MTPQQPRSTDPSFARWLNGDLTRFCGHGMHGNCKGTIDTIGVQAACLCACHKEQSAMTTPPVPEAGPQPVEGSRDRPCSASDPHDECRYANGPQDDNRSHEWVCYQRDDDWHHHIAPVPGNWR